MMIKSLFSFALTFLIVSYSLAVNAAVQYNLFSISEIFGNTNFILDINNSNKVLLLDNKTLGVKLWDGKNTSDIDTTIPSRMNDSGHFAISVNAGSFRHAGYWNGSETIELRTLSPFKSSALDINNSNQLVGYSNTDRGIHQAHATIWDADSNTVVDLGALKHGWNSYAFALNDHAQVVGFSQTKINSTGRIEEHATLWQGNKIIDLGGLNGENSSRAIDINNHGKILGMSNNNGSAPDHQIIWDISNLNDIKIDLIENAQYANAINDEGFVVGGSYDGYAFLWRDGQMKDLNQLIDPVISQNWHLFNAFDINNDGWIFGDAKNLTTGENAHFLITPNQISPIPEPSIYLMLILGLGIISLSLIKKKIKHECTYKVRIL